ncbi:MAG: hypothetical protein K0R15_2066 [Clostridiales bacterium]|jgi:stage V sporulation protein AC|nr:hypothetical protein [Clostridiales bacterium]
MISEKQKKEYKDYVEQKTPNHNLMVDMVLAFIFGGIFSVIAQGVYDLLMSNGFEKIDASTWGSISLIFISAVLTALGWYKKIVKYAGAGIIVPITGFANSVISTAIEYKNEGQVFGIGAKIFIIAGPVILFGCLSSVVIGAIYYIIQLVG